mmetsp:Transcript_72066/g.192599  ORF Transcript_72066/g.192599 Transcript_72066/m.192599 type:complete len:214 (-) Transcript_72066:564-1205(-)
MAPPIHVHCLDFRQEERLPSALLLALPQTVKPHPHGSHALILSRLHLCPGIKQFLYPPESKCLGFFLVVDFLIGLWPIRVDLEVVAQVLSYLPVHRFRQLVRYSATDLNNTHFLYSRNHTGIHLDQIRAHLFTKDQQATKDCLLLLRCFCAANLIVTLKKKNTRPAIMSSVSIDGIKVSRSARMRSIAISILEIMIGHISPMFGGRRERLSCA